MIKVSLDNGVRATDEAVRLYSFAPNLNLARARMYKLDSTRDSATFVHTLSDEDVETIITHKVDEASSSPNVVKSFNDLSLDFTSFEDLPQELFTPQVVKAIKGSASTTKDVIAAWWGAPGTTPWKRDPYGRWSKSFRYNPEAKFTPSPYSRYAAYLRLKDKTTFGEIEPDVVDSLREDEVYVEADDWVEDYEITDALGAMTHVVDFAHAHRDARIKAIERYYEFHKKVRLNEEDNGYLYVPARISLEDVEIEDRHLSPADWFAAQKDPMSAGFFNTQRVNGAESGFSSTTIEDYAVLCSSSDRTYVDYSSDQYKYPHAFIDVEGVLHVAQTRGVEQDFRDKFDQHLSGYMGETWVTVRAVAWSSLHEEQDKKAAIQRRVQEKIDKLETTK